MSHRSQAPALKGEAPRRPLAVMCLAVIFTLPLVLPVAQIGMAVVGQLAGDFDGAAELVGRLHRYLGYENVFFFIVHGLIPMLLMRGVRFANLAFLIITPIYISTVTSDSRSAQVIIGLGYVAGVFSLNRPGARHFFSSNAGKALASAEAGDAQHNLHAARTSAQRKAPPPPTLSQLIAQVDEESIKVDQAPTPAGASAPARREEPAPAAVVETGDDNRPRTIAEIVSPRFDALEFVGSGMTSHVYKARDTATGTTVALKVLNPYLHTDPISVERSRRELQITRRLQHPQIVAIYDLVITGDRTYLVMEYVPAADLKDFIRLNAPLVIEQALTIVRQLLDVIAVCHRHGVVHRDLKPQNILVTLSGKRPTLKLLDFGIARMTALADLTQTGTSIGTPEYMAPELYAANTYDARTDLYAIGVIAYELLAGRLPHQGDSLAVLYKKHLEDTPRRLSAIRADVPDWLSLFVERLLAKRPFERYQTAEEALADLVRQQVATKVLPALPRRDCFNCRQLTMTELPVCTHCGFVKANAHEYGFVSMRLSATAAPTTVARFLRKMFNLRPTVIRRRQVLALNISRKAAQYWVQVAGEHGVPLELVRLSPGDRSISRAAILGVTTFVFGLIALDELHPLPKTANGWSYLALFLALPALTGARTMISMRRYLLHKPLITDLNSIEPAHRSPAFWSPRLGQFFLATHPNGERAKEALTAILERQLMVDSVPAAAVATEALRPLLECAVDLGIVYQELSNTFDAADVQAAAELHQELTEARRTTADQQSAINIDRRLNHLGRIITDYAAVEERCSRLYHRLVYIASVYNALLTRLVAERLPFAESDREQLVAAIEQAQAVAAAEAEIRQAPGSPSEDRAA